MRNWKFYWHKSAFLRRRFEPEWKKGNARPQNGVRRSPLSNHCLRSGDFASAQENRASGTPSKVRFPVHATLCRIRLFPAAISKEMPQPNRWSLHAAVKGIMRAAGIEIGAYTQTFINDLSWVRHELSIVTQDVMQALFGKWAHEHAKSLSARIRAWKVLAGGYGPCSCCIRQFFRTASHKKKRKGATGSDPVKRNCTNRKLRTRLQNYSEWTRSGTKISKFVAFIALLLWEANSWMCLQYYVEKRGMRKKRF